MTIVRLVTENVLLVKFKTVLSYINQKRNYLADKYSTETYKTGPILRKETVEVKR